MKSTTFSQTPKFIKSRFFSLRSYVWYSFFPSDEYEKRLKSYGSKATKSEYKKKINEVVDEATVALFVFSIKNFLLNGTEVAQQAVDIYKDIGLGGFWIGTKEFKDKNTNVMLGKNLSDKLSEMLPEDLKNIIKQKKYPYEIIDIYKDIIKKI